MSGGDDLGARTQPSNLDAEASVLGSVMLENAVLGELVQHLAADHFYKGSHRLIFEAMVSLYDRGQAIDFVTLREELTKRGALDRVGGMDVIVGIASSVPSAANALEYSAIVREKSTLRSMI